MEATVTLSLKEMENLKSTIKKLNERIAELEQIKEPNHFVRISYDFTKGVSSYNTFGLKIVNEDNIDNKFAEIVESNFREILSKSKESKFYKQFPKWVHKLFGCN